MLHFDSTCYKLFTYHLNAMRLPRQRSQTAVDNIGGGFQHRPRPYPLEVNHCRACRLHATEARAVVCVNVSHSDQLYTSRVSHRWPARVNVGSAFLHIPEPKFKLLSIPKINRRASTHCEQKAARLYSFLRHSCTGGAPRTSVHSLQCTLHD